MSLKFQEIELLNTSLGHCNTWYALLHSLEVFYFMVNKMTKIETNTLKAGISGLLTGTACQYYHKASTSIKKRQKCSARSWKIRNNFFFHENIITASQELCRNAKCWVKKHGTYFHSCLQKSYSYCVTGEIIPLDMQDTLKNHHSMWKNCIRKNNYLKLTHREMDRIVAKHYKRTA